MKNNIRFFFLFLFSSLNLFGNNVHVLVDYTMNQNRLNQIKEKYSIAFSKKTDVHIIYIGKGEISKSDKYDPFKVSCGFDECEEINDYLNENQYDFVCVIRELSKCNRLQDELYFEDLNKSQKKNLKKSDNILLIDLKGVEIQPLPSISITPSEAEINAGEEILFNAQISNTSLKGTLEWFENGIKVESRILKYSTMPENDVQIICKWNFEDCTVESNEVNIKVKRCQSAIPYSLFFDNSAIYSRNINNSNKVYIYPMNDSNGSRVLLIKQDCFFSEFEMEILDKNDSLLGKKIFQINNKSSNQILQFLSIRDNSILAVDVQDLIDPFKEQFIYIRIIPTKIPMLEQNIPKYEVFFTSCSPNE
jgi:hypothetical protein